PVRLARDADVRQSRRRPRSRCRWSRRSTRNRLPCERVARGDSGLDPGEPRVPPHHWPGVRFRSPRPAIERLPNGIEQRGGALFGEIEHAIEIRRVAAIWIRYLERAGFRCEIEKQAQMPAEAAGAHRLQLLQVVLIHRQDPFEAIEIVEVDLARATIAEHVS